MTEEKSCYNCGNNNCNVYYSTVKKDYKRHFEVYEYKDFDCVNHNKWEELKVKENRTDNKETLKNALKRIAELKALIKSEHEIEARKNNNLVSQITKAKELIKELLKALDGRSGFNEDVFKQAEQFLEEKRL